MKAKVSIIKCNSYDPSLVLAATRRAIDLLGGIANFIKPETRVLVKPNLLMAIEPEAGVTTHPEVVRAVVKILKEIGCKVFIGDGPGPGGSQAGEIDKVYNKTGMRKVADEEGVNLVSFDKRRMIEGKFPLTTRLDDCDYFISIPKFKTHEYTILTGAVKNLFGLIPGTYKVELHKKYFYQEDFSKILADIYEIARPALTIIDGIVAMEGDGPATGGKLRNLNLLFAGSDCVALDSILALVMGLKPLDIPSTREANQRRLGVVDSNSIMVLGEKLDDVIGRPFLLPTTASLRKKIPPVLVKLIRNMIKFYPYVKNENCVRCGVCIQACPTKVVHMKRGRIVFDYRGCISCFCCQESCPAKAIKVKKSLLVKILGI